MGSVISISSLSSSEPFYVRTIVDKLSADMSKSSREGEEKMRIHQGGLRAQKGMTHAQLIAAPVIYCQLAAICSSI